MNRNFLLKYLILVALVMIGIYTKEEKKSEKMAKMTAWITSVM